MLRSVLCTCLLLVMWLSLFLPATAQTLTPSPPTLAVAPVDTVQVLHDLFAAKRKTGRTLLLLEPVALGMMVVSANGLFNAVLDGSGQAPRTLPTVGMVVSLVSVVGLPMQLLRNSRGREQEVIEKYQRTHRLPNSIRRGLQKRLAEPGS